MIEALGDPRFYLAFWILGGLLVCRWLGGKLAAILVVLQAILATLRGR